MNWDTYCSQYAACSKGAVEYLNNHPPKGKYLTMYNWGGYMIWNSPKVKPSVDGRMSFWKEGNTPSAFEIYYPLEQNNRDIQYSAYDTVMISNTKELYNRLLELVRAGKWKMVYHDKYGGVFERVKPQQD